MKEFVSNDYTNLFYNFDLENFEIIYLGNMFSLLNFILHLKNEIYNEKSLYAIFKEIENYCRDENIISYKTLSDENKLNEILQAYHLAISYLNNSNYKRYVCNTIYENILNCPEDYIKNGFNTLNSEDIIKAKNILQNKKDFIFDFLQNRFQNNEDLKNYLEAQILKLQNGLYENFLIVQNNIKLVLADKKIPKENRILDTRAESIIACALKYYDDADLDMEFSLSPSNIDISKYITEEDIYLIEKINEIIYPTCGLMRFDYSKINHYLKNNSGNEILRKYIILIRYFNFKSYLK